MSVSMNLRLIKLLTPNNEMISVELGGDENEFLDLVSMIVGIPVNGIKGIKDCFGNYYTISSAINNHNINSEHSDVYYLVCNAGANTFKNNNSFIGNNTSNINNNNSFCIGNSNNNYFKQPNLKNSHQLIRSESFQNKNNINKSIYRHKNNSNNITPKTFQHNQTNQLNQVNQDVFQFPVTSPRFPDAFSPVDKYLSITQNLYESNQIDIKIFSILSQMILKENEEVINLLRVYCQDIIDRQSLINGLNKIVNNNFSNVNMRPTSPVNIKNKLFNLIEQLENDLVLDDPSDYILLKNFVEYENEFIMGAFEVYEADNDFDNFIESVKILINKNKKKSNQFYSNLKISEPKINRDDSRKSSRKNNFNKIQSNDILDMPLDLKNESTYIKTKTSPVKPHQLTKEAETQILSCLHTEERIIFKYSLRNKFPEIEVISQLYETFLNTELVIKPVKHLCKKFINDIVLKKFDEILKTKFNQILKNREQNKNLVAQFKEFNEHQNLERLSKDIENYLKNHMLMSNKTIKSSAKKSSSDSESLIEDDESLMKENKRESLTTENNTSNANYEDFLNLVNLMKFLKTEDKRELEKLVKNKNKMAMELVENYYKNKNIVALKPLVLNLLKNKNNLSQSSNSRKRSSTEEIKNKIYNKLENKIQEININLEEKSTFNSLENLLIEMEKSGKISSLQHKFILQRYKNKDDMVSSFWEIYQKYLDLPELIESLKVFASNFHRNSSFSHSNNSNVFPPPVTPADLKESKKEIIEFLKSKTHEKEKSTVKIMQYNMIKILARDNSVEINNLPILKEMILKENPLLISAFEVFGVTKDHKDFSHTINILSYLYNENGNSPNSEKDYLTHLETKEMKLFNLFENFLINRKEISEKDSEILKKKLQQKNQFLMSSLELFESTQDSDEFLDTLKIILKNKNL